jgi:hypothetical protein
MMGLRVVGLLLNALGVIALLYGGVPYRTRDTVLEIGPLKATAEMEKKAEIPPPVGAGLVGVGSALLFFASFGSRRRD